MRQIDFSGFPFPATPAEGRVGLLLLKYAWLGHRADGNPERDDRCADPDQPDSVAAGHRPRLHQRAGRSGRLRVLPRAAVHAGHEHRLLGSADQGRHAAASPQHQHGRAHQLRVAVLHLRQPAARDAGWSTCTTSSRRFRSPFRFPNITPLSPPLGLVEPTASQAQADRGCIEVLDSRRR